MAKRVSTRALKKHRHYTYEDAADALGVTAQTVRSWRAHGLRVLDEKRPHLMLGEDLIVFLKARQAPAERPAPGTFRCFSCREQTRPLDGVAFYTPLGPNRGQLEALCGECQGLCFRFASEASLGRLGAFLEIVRCDPTQA